MSDAGSHSKYTAGRRNPHSREEWQRAVAAAKAVQVWEDARNFEFVDERGRPDLNRCAEILIRARQLSMAD